VRSLGHYAYRWRGRIVLLAVAVAIAAAAVGSSVFDEVKPFGFQDPDSESSRATETLEDASGVRPLPDVELLVEPDPSAPADLESETARVKRELEAVPGVVRVLTPQDQPALLSEDGGAALVLGFAAADTDDPSEVGERVERTFENRPDVTTGGAAVAQNQLNQTTEDDLRRIELVAAPILFLLSLLVFRGLVAATLPLVVGALSIIATLFLLRVLTEVMEIDLFVINIVTGLGLGLAIDYSLFVVTRFREELNRGLETGEALRETMGANGRMIVFSGLTVAAALLSLCIFPQRFLYSIGVGGALVALTSALVCLTVLPALLALLGPRVNALSTRRLRRSPGEKRWYDFGRFVLRHPVAITVLLVTTMIAAGLPFLRVELTRADATVLPPDASAHQVSEIIDDDFAVDPGALITVVLEGSPGNAQLKEARRELLAAEGVGTVLGPNEAGPGVMRVDALLNVGSFSDTALDAVDVARNLEWGTEAEVTGPPAELADQRSSLADHLPYAIAFIVVSTLLLLFALTRSVVLPFLALLMNMLTVSVAFGVLVLVFQDGRFESALDYTSQMALDTSMPILLFAVAFGLSTDYGVFLLQRISEERKRAKDDADAIARGLARSGRPITAAALLFAVAMGAFAFSDLIFIKEVAVGTAVAVIVDATLVRALLFPALLCMLGPAAWWSPKALRRRPRIS
jgi:RND superfamily putative drug exporter